MQTMRMPMIDLCCTSGSYSSVGFLVGLCTGSSNAYEQAYQQLASTTYQQYRGAFLADSQYFNPADLHNARPGGIIRSRPSEPTAKKPKDVLKVRMSSLHRQDNWSTGATVKPHMRFDGQDWVHVAVGRIGPRTRGLRPAATGHP
jgi:hypothetical protein